MDRDIKRKGPDKVPLLPLSGFLCFNHQGSVFFSFICQMDLIFSYAWVWMTHVNGLLYYLLSLSW